jgi:hypothetical protein
VLCYRYQSHADRLTQDDFQDAKDDTQTSRPQDGATLAHRDSDEEKALKRTSQADSAKVMEDAAMDDSSTIEDSANKSMVNGGSTVTSIESEMIATSAAEKNNHDPGGRMHPSYVEQDFN